MTFAQELNHLEVDPSEDNGEVTLVQLHTDEDKCAAFEYDRAYISRSHSDDPFTYFVVRGTKAAKWDHHENEWVDTTV